MDAEHIEEVRGSQPGEHHAAAGGGPVGVSLGGVGGEAGEGLHPFPHEIELDPTPIPVVPEDPELGLAGYGQRPEEEPPHRAEQRCGGAKSQRQREQGEEIDSRAPAELPERVTQVIEEITQHGDPPGLPGPFLLIGHPAESKPRNPRRFNGVHSLSLQLFGFHLQVKGDLFSELPFRGAQAEHRPEPKSPIADPAPEHGQVAARIRATPLASRCQCAVSTSSCRAPSLVRA